MQPAPPKPKRTKRYKWLIIGALPVIVIAVIVLFFILDAEARRIPAQIQARIDALKRAGIPITAQDLDKLYPPLPDAQNSALIYMRATNFSGFPPGYTNWPVYGKSLGFFATNTLPTQVKEEIGQYIRQNQATLDLLHQASAIKQGYYELGYKNGFVDSSFVRPPLVVLREQAQLLAITTVFYAENRQPGPATHNLLDSLGLSRSLDRDPRLVCQLIRWAILALSCDTLEFALNRMPFSEEQLRSLAEAFERPQIMGSLKQALVTERCEGIFYGQSLLTNSASPDESFLDRLKDVYYRIRYYRQSDFGFYLDVMKEFIDATDLPDPKNFETAKELELKVEKNASSKRAFGIVLQMVSGKAFLNTLRCQAKLRLAQTALAVERFRLTHGGQLPDSLSMLVPAYLPAVPVYPFDGQPLRLKALTRGYIICPSTTNPTPEITFSVER